MEALERARRAVVRWRGSEAEAALAAARGAERVAVRYPGPAAVEAFCEAKGELPPAERDALAAHLAAGVAERALRPGREALAVALEAPVAGRRGPVPWRRALEALFDGPEPGRDRRVLGAAEAGAGPLAERLAEARSAADDAARRALSAMEPGRHADAGPAAGDGAAAWLDATEDLWAAERSAWGIGRDLGALLRALRAAELDGPLEAERRARWKRLGALWRPLGLEGVLAERARVEAPHGLGDPAPRLCLPRPREVRILPGFAPGLFGELLAARAVGRALGHALVSPALPHALRRPVVGTVPRALGQLPAQRLAEPGLWRARGLGAGEAERMGRRSAGILLLLSRVDAAAALARGLRDPSGRGGGLLLAGDAADAPVVGERCRELAERALGVALPEALARLLLHTPSRGRVRLRAA
ncbi:MAG TPA: hypothetical protein RMH80_15060, partial [Polyangiaceae bacterium LLY-WYZ-15_(1-7)]|nr:hypothetical protein [Polyangiaceae bacterium LLY-WYZ-15_(1-7)]